MAEKNRESNDCAIPLNMLKITAVILVLLAHNVVTHAYYNKEEAVAGHLIQTNAPSCADETYKDRCSWINEDKSRAANYCGLNNVKRGWLKCNLSCGRCCKDEPSLSNLFFYIDGIKRKCNYLSNFNRRKTHCPKKSVYSLCPESCGVCCKNNNSYRFTTEDGKSKGCSWITQQRRAAYCEGPGNYNNYLNCKGSCSCRNLSGRKQVSKMDDRFPCEETTKELGLEINPLLFQQVGQDYSDNCELVTSTAEDGWIENEYECNYDKVTNVTKDNCENRGGILFELMGWSTCTFSSRDQLDLITENTYYNNIHICLSPECDIESVIKGMTKYESFSKCGSIRLKNVANKSPETSLLTQPTSQPTLYDYDEPTLKPELKNEPKIVMTSDLTSDCSWTKKRKCKKFESCEWDSSTATCLVKSMNTPQPTPSPTFEPTSQVTAKPTSGEPTSEPTTVTSEPTSGEPTYGELTSGEPTPQVTAEPTSGEPTSEPTTVTSAPTLQVTAEPTSGEPTSEPTTVTSAPTSQETSEPTSGEPTSEPTITFEPTPQEASEPTYREPTTVTPVPTSQETSEPTSEPTSGEPTSEPTIMTSAPTPQVTPEPTSGEPTIVTSAPTPQETSELTSEEPTSGESTTEPTTEPTITITLEPTDADSTLEPTTDCSWTKKRKCKKFESCEWDSSTATCLVKSMNTPQPTLSPTFEPTSQVTAEPTSGQPSPQVTAEPTSGEPTSDQTMMTSAPTPQETSEPTSGEPTSEPTAVTSAPTSQETSGPTSGEPTSEPTTVTSAPTSQETSEPTSGEPTSEPTIVTSAPISQETSEPTSGEPTSEPTTTAETSAPIFRVTSEPTAVSVSSVPTPETTLQVTPELTTELTTEPTPLHTLKPISQVATPTTHPTSEPTPETTAEPTFVLGRIIMTYKEMLEKLGVKHVNSMSEPMSEPET